MNLCSPSRVSRIACVAFISSHGCADRVTAHSFEGMPEVILEIDTQVYLRADRVGTAWEGRGHKTKLVRPIFCPTDNHISRQTRHLDDEVISYYVCSCFTADTAKDADAKRELIVLHLRISSCVMWVSLTSRLYPPGPRGKTQHEILQTHPFLLHCGDPVPVTDPSIQNPRSLARYIGPNSSSLDAPVKSADN